MAEDGLGSDRFKDKFEWVILLKDSPVKERAALRAVELPASIKVAALVVVQWAEGRQSSLTEFSCIQAGVPCAEIGAAVSASLRWAVPR